MHFQNVILIYLFIYLFISLVTGCRCKSQPSFFVSPYYREVRPGFQFVKQFNYMVVSRPPPSKKITHPFQFYSYNQPTKDNILVFYNIHYFTLDVSSRFDGELITEAGSELGKMFTECHVIQDFFFCFHIALFLFLLPNGKVVHRGLRDLYLQIHIYVQRSIY